MIKSQELADMLLEAYSEHCQISNIELFKNFIKRETIAQVFSCEFCEISKNTFFLTEHLRATASTYVKHSSYCTWKCNQRKNKSFANISLSNAVFKDVKELIFQSKWIHCFRQGCNIGLKFVKTPVFLTPLAENMFFFSPKLCKFANTKI